MIEPSETGKSTLVRIISTLQWTNIGAVTLSDIKVMKQKYKVRSVTSYLPQQFCVYPMVSAEEMFCISECNSQGRIVNLAHFSKQVKRTLKSFEKWENIKMCFPAER